MTAASVNDVAARPSAILMPPASHPISERKTSYTTPEPAPLQLSCTWRPLTAAESAGAGGGVQAEKQTAAPGSVGQAIPCRLKAANSWQEWGVPFDRSPSSSSAARRVFQSEPALHPFEIQGEVEMLQAKPWVDVARDRYQRRSATAQAAALPGAGRSRAARSHSASDMTCDSQCPWRPQGPK